MRKPNLRCSSTKNAWLNVVDVETTGFDTDPQRIIEIWVGKYRGTRRKKEFHRMINPNCEISRDAQEIHGITLKRVRKAPRFREIAEDLVEFIGTDPIVCHKSDFDIRLINSELKMAHRRRLTNTVIDTLKLATKQFRFKRGNKLDNVVRELGLRNKPRHRATSDGKATAAVFFKMMRVFEREWELSFADIDDLQNEIRTPSAKRVKKDNKMRPKYGEWKTP